MRRDPNFDLDLNIFQQKDIPAQLNRLTVRIGQISSYFDFGGLHPDERNYRIREWVKTSTLEQLRVYITRTSVITFYQDGTMKMQEKKKK